MPAAGVTVFAVTPLRWLFSAGLSGRGRLCPGAEVFGGGVPGQEPFQAGPDEGFPAVAAACVEVGGEEGQDVQPGHLGGGGDGPYPAAFRAVSPFREP